MPADRWRWINGLVYTPEVEAALGKQARGERLTDDERRELNVANQVIASEIRSWERGEPIDDGTVSPTPATPSVPGTPVPGDPGFPLGPPPTGTPGPTSTPGRLEDMVPEDLDPDGLDLSPPGTPAVPPGPPADTGMNFGPTFADTSGPTDEVLTVEDPYGNQMIMTRGDYEGQDPGYKATLTVVSMEPPGTRETRVPESSIHRVAPPSAPAAAPPAAATKPPPPPAPPAAATKTPPQKLPPQPPIKAPFQDDQRTPAPPPPASLAPPSPFRTDASGALLPEGRFTRAIARAGGRPTRPVAEQAAREIGDVFRPGADGGYRGDTGGWRTLAQQAAAAWEQQYREAPSTLRPSERQAYERDPSSLYKTILAADSPFRDYRESWIGAARNGEVVPDAQAFVGELQGYPGGPQPRTRPSPLPNNGVSNTTDAGGVPRVYTPGASGPPPPRQPDMPRQPDILSPDIMTEPPLQTAPEPARVVPYADETPTEAAGRGASDIMPEAELAPPEMPPPPPPEEQQQPDQYVDQGYQQYDEQPPQAEYVDQGEQGAYDEQPPQADYEQGDQQPETYYADEQGDSGEWEYA